MMYCRLLILLISLLPTVSGLCVTILVANGNNDGPGSLRRAIANAQNNDVIAFQGPFAVQLLSPLILDKTVSIVGIPNARITRAIGAPLFRLITVDNFTPRTGVITFQDLTFSDGVASVGAAIRNFYPFFEVVNCTFEQNNGSAISSSTNSTNVVIRQCVFRNNQGELGVGFENISGTVTIERCDFFGNIASVDGGAIFASGGDVIVRRSTLRGNRAVNGGAIAASNANITIVNGTITGNRATQLGGGIALYGTSTLNMHSSTISGNVAVNGGAIRQSSTSSATLVNTISWGNSSEFSTVAGTATTVSFSIVQGGFAGTGNLDANPLFISPLPLTNPNPDIGGNFQLQACSPAINAGTATGAPNNDLNGTVRPLLGAYDMGAYECNTLTSAGIAYVLPAATGSGNGNSWTNAFTNLQTALSFARQCPQVREIWVAKGTYKPAITTNNRDSAFAMVNNVSIYGGFAGTETQLSQRNWRLNPTILSGDIGVQGNRSDNAHNVISNNNNGLNTTAILDGFIIRDGQANKAEYARARGGGMFNLNSSPMVRNCIFFGNFSAEYGGAVFNQGASATPTFVNCVFSGNQAQFGGGIYNESAQTQVINCTFSSNQISGNGGGMYSYGTPKAVVQNSIVWGNANNGIFTATIDNSTPVEVNHSLVQGGYTGTANLNVDPRFNVQASIGLGQLGDLRLLVCSPARNAGRNEALPAGITTDLAGLNRIWQTTVDMGAYERQNQAGSIVYLDATATGANDGNSWANAFTTLEAALNDINLCSGGGSLTIQIAAGTYAFPAGKSILIDNLNATILGGYPAGGGSRNAAANPVIIKGEVRVLKNVTIDGVKVEK